MGIFSDIIIFFSSLGRNTLFNGNDNNKKNNRLSGCRDEMFTHVLIILILGSNT